MRARLIGAERVSCRFGHDVRGVERTSRGFRVEGTTADGHRWADEASVVVNCLWDGRLAIDRLLGLTPARPWVYRLKYRVLARLPARLAALPSLTLVLGRYGDLVNYGDGRVYLSWYPTCLRGWSSDVEVPACWHRHRGGDVVGPEADAVARDTLAAFDRIVPGLAACRVESVAAGVIFSWGETDIDNPQSELHRRDDIGPEIFDGYVTVNTGKLTMAPLFAGRVVELLR